MKRLVLSIALLSAAAQAQIIQSVPRQLSTQPGTASIAGAVLNDVTGEPIKKAQVIIGGAFSGPPLTAVTDATGRFVFKHLPAGTLMLNASHPSYDGSRSTILGQNQKEATVTADQELTGIELRLTPMGSISGRLIDEYGDPAPNCMVGAQAASVSGSNRGIYPQSAATDDRGEYVITGLPAGRYYVFERCLGALAAPHDFLQRGDPRTPALIFVPEYYGGMPGPAGANAVAVTPGGEVRGIDFRVRTATGMRVQIGVRSDQPLSDPRSVMVTIHPEHSTWGMQAMPDPKTGGYVAQPLAPGTYVVSAQTQPDGKLFGKTRIEVGETAPPPVWVTLAEGLSIAGTVRVDGEHGQSHGEARIMLLPVGQDQQTMQVPQAVVSSDGAFTLTGVAPGRYRIETPGVAGQIRTASFGDRDVSPYSLDIPEGGGGPLNLLLSTKQIPMTVSVAGVENGRQGWVIAVANAAEADPSMRQSTAQIQGGQGTMSVAPGVWLVLAVDCPQPWALMHDAALWHALADRGKVVEVKDDAENVSVSVDLITRDNVKNALDGEIR